MIELHYPGLSQWFYAPQMRVRETTGAGGVTITGGRFTLPGFDGPAWTCATGQHLNAGETRELFPEMYGDYPLTFDESGRRIVGMPAIAISFVDDSGRTGVLTVDLPVTPGSVPTTYSGGSGGWTTCR